MKLLKSIEIICKYVFFASLITCTINGQPSGNPKNGAVWGMIKVPLFSDGKLLDTLDYRSFVFSIAGTKQITEANRNGFFLINDISEGYRSLEISNRKLVEQGILESMSGDSILCRFDSIHVVTDSLTFLSIGQGNIPGGYWARSETVQLKKPVGLGVIHGRCLLDSFEGGYPLGGIGVSVNRLSISNTNTISKSEEVLWMDVCNNAGQFVLPELITGFYAISVSQYYELAGHMTDLIGKKVIEIKQDFNPEIEVIVSPNPVEEIPTVKPF